MSELPQYVIQARNLLQSILWAHSGGFPFFGGAAERTPVEAIASFKTRPFANFALEKLQIALQIEGEAINFFDRYDLLKLSLDVATHAKTSWGVPWVVDELSKMARESDFKMRTLLMLPGESKADRDQAAAEKSKIHELWGLHYRALLLHNKSPDFLGTVVADRLSELPTLQFELAAKFFQEIKTTGVRPEPYIREVLSSLQQKAAADSENDDRRDAINSFARAALRFFADDLKVTNRSCRSLCDLAAMETCSIRAAQALAPVLESQQLTSDNQPAILRGNKRGELLVVSPFVVASIEGDSATITTFNPETPDQLSTSLYHRDYFTNNPREAQMRIERHIRGPAWHELGPANIDSFWIEKMAASFIERLKQAFEPGAGRDRPTVLQQALNLRAQLTPRP